VSLSVSAFLVQAVAMLPRPYLFASVSRVHYSSESKDECCAGDHGKGHQVQFGDWFPELQKQIIALLFARECLRFDYRVNNKEITEVSMASIAASTVSSPFANHELQLQPELNPTFLHVS
jgi:hypothetical protein